MQKKIIYKNLNFKKQKKINLYQGYNLSEIIKNSILSWLSKQTKDFNQITNSIFNVLLVPSIELKHYIQKQAIEANVDFIGIHILTLEEIRNLFKCKLNIQKTIIDYLDISLIAQSLINQLKICSINVDDFMQIFKKFDSISWEITFYPNSSLT